MKKGRLTRDIKLKAKEILGEEAYKTELRNIEGNALLDNELKNDLIIEIIDKDKVDTITLNGKTIAGHHKSAIVLQEEEI